MLLFLFALKRVGTLCVYILNNDGELTVPCIIITMLKIIDDISSTFQVTKCDWMSSDIWFRSFQFRTLYEPEVGRHTADMTVTIRKKWNTWKNIIKSNITEKLYHIIKKTSFLLLKYKFNLFYNKIIINKLWKVSFDISGVTSEWKVGIGSNCTMLFVFNIEIIFNNINRRIITFNLFNY